VGAVVGNSIKPEERTMSDYDETHHVQVRLENDQDFSDEVQRMIRELDPDGGDPAVTLAGEIKGMWEDFTDPENYEAAHFIDRILPIIVECGTTCRVDWVAIARSCLAP
jgi:hypothetical protein